LRDKALNSNTISKAICLGAMAVAGQQLEAEPVGLGPQRAAPVVVPEGPSAGGGVFSIAVDPGVPLGPGLLATCLVFHGPPARMANPRTNATMMIASVLPLIELFLS